MFVGLGKQPGHGFSKTRTVKRLFQDRVDRIVETRLMVISRQHENWLSGGGSLDFGCKFVPFDKRHFHVSHYQIELCLKEERKCLSTVVGFNYRIGVSC